ncbi:efflux RND transporter periplasmic adaptor subunit [Sporomusa sp. KB1]|uniref:efflux RND transporter periplasmic adaptor subunit n=1 Tax=Sporomusa sp. KB1 TaxID=943346 RepID=UPI0021030A9E|nr:efflux RND transporter periplasmic adaptor subunit [Sporomusa sp. KB1]
MHASKQIYSGKVQTTVDVTNVQRTNLIKRISLTGQTVAEAQVDIAAKYQGKVTAVNVSLGQSVSPGQVLVVQDTGDAEISINQNQAAYQQASADAVTNEVAFNANYDKVSADYQKAAASYQRNKRLFDIGGVSKGDLDVVEQQLADAKAAFDALSNQMKSGVASTIQSSQASVLKAQHGISAAQKQRDDLILRAPRSGMIGYRQVEVGDIVSAGQKLLSIYDNSNIYVDCQVAEEDLSALSIGMDINVQLESLGKTVPGKIIYISPAIDSQNLVFSLRIALINPDPSIRAGMFARAVIQLPLRQNTLVVPKEALVDKSGKNYVYVVTAQNTVEQRTVQIGTKGDQNVEILEGLNEGEHVAINNLARLRNEMVIVPNFITPNERGENQ